jgi:hypothetical protein
LQHPCTGGGWHVLLQAEIPAAWSMLFFNASINVVSLFYYSDICFYLSELYNKIFSIETINTLIGFVASYVPFGPGNAP